MVRRVRPETEKGVSGADRVPGGGSVSAPGCD